MVRTGLSNKQGEEQLFENTKFLNGDYHFLCVYTPYYASSWARRNEDFHTSQLCTDERIYIYIYRPIKESGGSKQTDRK